MPISKAEESFEFQLRALGMSGYVREHVFAPPRRWRFDFAFPQEMIAAEIEGGVFTNGRHTRGVGFTKDLEKYNAATSAGWRVFRFTPKHVKSGEAVQLIEAALLSQGVVSE